MFGLADARRSRASAALIRICKEMSSACQEFRKSQLAEMPLPKLETGLTRLRRTVATSYYTSGRVAATFYRSETNGLNSEIEALHHLSNEITRFQAKSRDITTAHEQVREQATLLGEHLEALERLKDSRSQLEREFEEMGVGMKSLQDEISEIRKNPGITSVDDFEAELRRLRRKLLDEEMSRLGGVMTRFLALLQRGEGDLSRDSIDVLSRYLETPLTSLAREGNGYPRLRIVLTGLLGAVEKTGLREKKARKALERARRILDGSLLPLQQEARQAFKARSELLRSETVRELRSRRVVLRGEYAKLLGRRKELESKRERVAGEIAALQGQVVVRFGRIEKLASEGFGKKVPEALKEQVILASRG